VTMEKQPVSLDRIAGVFNYGPKTAPAEWIRFPDGSSQVKDKDGNVLLVAGMEATRVLVRMKKLKITEVK